MTNASRGLLLLLASTVLLAVPAAASDTDRMARKPPPTPDEAAMVEPAPDPALIDPGMAKPVSPTEPATVSEPSGGAITSGVCMKAGRSTGAISRRQCRSIGGTWHDMQVGPQSGRSETHTNGGVPRIPTNP